MQEESLLHQQGGRYLKKTLTKKVFIEERGFKEVVPPLKEEIERRGYEAVSKQLESSRRALVKDF